jgi:hypothetical protein
MAERGFDFWWTVPGEWVEEPNRRRKGWSGMMRSLVEGDVYYVKRQLNHQCRTWSHPFGWPTASREWHNLKLLADAGIGAPPAVFHAVRRSAEGLEAVVVTRELSGFEDLQAWERLEPESRLELALAVGSTLGRLHRARLQHSSLYDKHIMARRTSAGFETALIDLETMRPRLTAGLAAGRDLKQFHRRQKVFGESEWAALREAHARVLNVA